MRHWRPVAITLLLALSLLTSLPSAPAAITAEGDVTPAMPPAWTSSTDVCVGNTFAGTLTVDSGDDLLSRYPRHRSLRHGATGLLRLTGPSSTWTSSAYVYAGSEGNGTLTIANGASLTTGHSYIAASPGATGDATVDGNGSSWQSGGSLHVGASGTATLSITNGGYVSDETGYVADNPGSIGAVTVDGDGSRWHNAFQLYIGNGSNATLSIANGGDVDSSHDAYVGYYAGSAGPYSGASGTVTVDGLGSTWTTNGTLYLGYDGRASVSITNQAYVSSEGAYLAYNPDSIGAVTVDGPGSRWVSNGALDVGFGGTATLSITNGAFVASGFSLIGNSLASKGVVLVDGNSAWETSGIYVGSNGSGELSIINGGSVTSSFAQIDAFTPGATAKVLIDNGSTWTNSDLYIASCGSGSLSITNAGSVTTSYTIIGSSSGSTALVTVDGAGSTWVNNNSLSIASSGTATLVITNGGSVSVGTQTYVGPSPASLALIDFGTNGGTLSTQSLYISPSQAAGTGTINACGLVTDANLQFDADHGLLQSLKFQDSGQNVTVNLDMTQLNYGDLGAGWKGTGSITIQGGLSVTSSQGSLGFQSGASGAATVTGAGSTWDSSLSLNIGVSGTGTLSITNGGSVSSGSSCIGLHSGSAGTVTVDGPESIWTPYNLSIGGNAYSGNFASGVLAITNGATVSVSSNTRLESPAAMIDFGANGGTLTTGALMASPDLLKGVGSIIAHGLISDVALLLDSPDALQQTLHFQQSGQDITLNLDILGGSYPNATLGAGWNGAGSLTIRNGLAITSPIAYIGYGSGSSGTVTVSEIGSTWNPLQLNVGLLGSAELQITDGGSLVTSWYTNTEVGVRPGSSGTISIDGAGSTWNQGTPVSASSRLYLGGYPASYPGGNGTLSITHGGSATTNDSYLGAAPGSKGFATIDGAGSTWTTDEIRVGAGDSFGAGSGTLSIQSGGSVTSDTAAIGYGAGATGLVAVSGPSTWTVSNNLTVGANSTNLLGGSGVLSIASGGTVSSSTANIGCANGSTGAVSVDGPGSTWNNTRNLYIGSGSGTATLRITNGGKVTSATTYGSDNRIGGAAGLVAVDGAGSLWTTSGSLTVGYNGCGTLSITSGGTVSSGPGLIAPSSYPYPPLLSGQVFIDGPGSTWTSTGSISVIYGALSITRGGRLNSTGGGSAGATVSVDGAGSIWSNTGDLTVGSLPSAPFTITHGGAVTCTTGYISSYNSTTPATVTVDGPGSTWTSTGNIYVGNNGAATLAITHGGSVTSANSYIKSAYSFRPSIVTVDGPGSTWTTSGALRIGDSGAATLAITHGGCVTSGSALIANQSAASVTVSGTGSNWNNTANLSTSGILSIVGGGSVTTGGLALNYPSRVAIDVGRGSQLTVAGSVGSYGGAIQFLAGAGVAPSFQCSPISLQYAARLLFCPLSAHRRNLRPDQPPLYRLRRCVRHFRNSAQRRPLRHPARPDHQHRPRRLGARRQLLAPPYQPVPSLAFTATTMDDAILNPLRNSLPDGENVLSGWTFSANTTPVYLSLKVGPGRSEDDLSLWSYNGYAWTEYVAPDLTYDGTYASFLLPNYAVMSTAGFAVTAIPEPGTLALLACAALTLLAYFRRRRC